MPILPFFMYKTSELLLLMTKTESIPSLNKVEVADCLDSFRIESEEVLYISSLTPGYKVPMPILLFKSEYNVWPDKELGGFA